MVKKVFFGLLIALLVGFHSCRTARDITETQLKPLSPVKILNQARQNAFDFDNLTINRINVQFQNGDSRTSFRASLKAVKDEKLLVSVSKLNIPVGRILLMPDSAIYVNYMDKNYYAGDYSFINNLLNFNLTFDIIQAVVTNPIRTRNIDSRSGNRQFDSFIENGKYVLHQNVEPDEITANSENYFLKKNRLIKKDNNMVAKRMVFNPINFALEKMIMVDVEAGRMLEVDFYNFEKVDGYNYPGNIDVRMMEDNDLSELKIKLNGFNTNKIESLNISIPERYLPIRRR